jgi:Fe-S-cluster containining protein
MPRPEYADAAADDAMSCCSLCAAADKCCCRTDPALAHLIFPLSPAERQRLVAVRGKAVSGLCPERTDEALSGLCLERNQESLSELCPERIGDSGGECGRTAANTAAGGEPPWAAQPNTPDFIRAVHSLFPKDKKRIDELFPADGEHKSLRLRPDGACVFLDGDGCRLPRAVRPGYCLLFPVWIVGGALTMFVSQECLIARKAGNPARCAELMGTDRVGLSLTYARLRHEWGLDAER